MGREGRREGGRKEGTEGEGGRDGVREGEGGMGEGGKARVGKEEGGSIEAKVSGRWARYMCKGRDKVRVGRGGREARRE